MLADFAAILHPLPIITRHMTFPLLLSRILHLQILVLVNLKMRGIICKSIVVARPLPSIRRLSRPIPTSFVKIVVRNRMFAHDSVRISLKHFLTQMIRHWRYPLSLLLLINRPISRLPRILIPIMLHFQHLNIIAVMILVLALCHCGCLA